MTRLLVLSLVGLLLLPVAASAQYGYQDKPVAADYDGDGKTDLAFTRASVSEQWYWYIKPSGGGPVLGIYWGLADDVPVVGDFDGDGKADLTVFRPSTGYWYTLKSSTGYTTYTITPPPPL